MAKQIIKKILLIPLIFISLIFLSSNVFAALTCSVKTSCASNEIPVFSMFDPAGGHASIYTTNTAYNYKVCCGGVAGLTNSCTRSSTILNLFKTTDSHAQIATETDYTNKICLNLLCSYSQDCSSLGEGYTCLASIAKNTDSHIGDCNAFSTKICCKECSAEICDGIDNDCDGITDEDCVEEISMKISLSTTKDSYSVNEQVELTDPPLESSLSESIINQEGKAKIIDTEKEVFQQRYVEKEVFQQRDTEKELPKSKGYIVEFKEKPIIVKKIELEREIKQKREESKRYREKAEKSAFIAKFYNSQISSNLENQATRSENELLSNLKKQEDRILKEHKGATDDIKKRALSITEYAVEEVGKTNKNLKEYIKVFNGIALDISATEANKIKESKYVKRIYPNLEVKTTLMDSVPLINADNVWQLDEDGNNCLQTGKVCITGKGITIAIIDTGIDYTHPDLKRGCLGTNCKVLGGYDFVNNDNDPMDDHGHGTHVAATAAGNGILRGVAPGAKLFAYKVLNSDGSGYTDWIIAGIERAVDPNQDGDFDDHVDIISMSLGASCWGYNEDCGPDDPISTAIDNAVDAGVVAVIAAGNSGSNSETIASPGTARKAITVGATYKIDYTGDYWEDTDPRVDQITSFSSRGPVIWENEVIIKPDIVAPGAIICAAQWDNAFEDGGADGNCNNDNNHVAISGTSMATPHVAGVVALIKQKHPDWSPVEIKMALRNSAIDVGNDINTYGYGRVDALGAISANKPPVSLISTSGLIGGEDENIIGIATADNFNSYSLYYVNSLTSTAVEREICSSTSPVVESVLCNWDIRNFPWSTLYLKLDVKSTSGDISSDYAIVEIDNTRIKSPKDLEDFTWGEEGKILATWQQQDITIEGISGGYNFDHYTLDLCLEDTTTCFDDVINVKNGGLLPIENEILGIIDLSKISNAGFYDLKLTTYYKDGKIDSDSNTIYIETTLHDGWPKNLFEASEFIAPSFLDQPTIADINNDGKKDLVMAYIKTVYVIDHEGLPIQGWPVIIGENYGTMQDGPAVADLDNDGKNEIVIGDNLGYIHVLNHDGTYLFQPKQVGRITTPAIEDVNNDGRLDIIAGDWDGYVHVLNDIGNYLQGWPVYLSPSENYPYSNGIYQVASIADINNDGYKEIFVKSSSCSVSSSCGPENTISRVWILDYLGRKIDSGWPKEFIDGSFGSNMILADIDNDNQIEVITGSYFGTVYAWNIDGSNVLGWPVYINTLNPTNYPAPSEPSIGDIDKDSQLEVLISGRGCINVYEQNGVLKFLVCIEKGRMDSMVDGNIVIENLDSDSKYEIVPSSSGGYAVNGLFPIYAFNDDGSIAEGFPKYLDDMVFTNVIPVADLDNDGKNELVVRTWTGLVYIYDINADSLVVNDGYEWPMFHHDAQHTGLYDKPVSCVEDWVCSDWSECIDGEQNRNCADQNNCGTAANKPSETQDCTFAAKSMIDNTGAIDVSGNLLMKVQKEIGNQWQDIQTIVNQEATVPANNYLALDTIWADAGFYTTTESGNFRVYAEFIYDSSVVSNSYEFEVN